MGDKEAECVTLALLCKEALCGAVAHALSVALSHCEGEAVKLAESVPAALPDTQPLPLRVDVEDPE